MVILEKETRERAVKVKLLEVSDPEWTEIHIKPELYHSYPCMIDGKLYMWVAVPEKPTEDDMRKVAASIVFEAEKLIIREVSVDMGVFNVEKYARALSEGAVLAGYSFSRYRKEKEPRIGFHVDTEHKDAVGEGAFVAEVTNYVRDMVNTPPNDFPPERFVEEAKELSSCEGTKVRAWKGKELLEKNFMGTYVVGKGSSNLPVFLHLSYEPFKASKTVVVIGKGITFDSGGLSIKPPSSMETMKMDKAGACAVLGLFKYTVEKRLPVNLHVLIPSAENMPDAGAYRPDDIITFPNGVSVEIHSTDAEGRLLLADALCYSKELDPYLIVDVATLTGACVVALGKYTSGLFCNNRELEAVLMEASQKTGEKLWPMPLDEDLEEDLKTEHADTRNNAKTRYGGAITAALFLKKFVKEGIAWAHIDIAGPAYLEKRWKYYRAGATGQPFRTLVRLIEQLARRNQP